mmetsp:Transcript_21563/g.32954  ORF Transcript_21563/g.32954 Transcript_21563/m.32954 type:complete len:290 (+) Transcript_21563:3895-4764(+)
MSHDGYGNNEEMSYYDANVITSGWLKKKKQSSSIPGSKWNSRWFALEKDAFCWYLGCRRSPKNNCPSGRILLSDIERVYRLAVVKEKHKNILIIRSKYRALCLKAKTSGDCERWIRSIQIQLDLRSGGTVSGPKSRKNSRISCKSTFDGGDKFELTAKSLNIANNPPKNPVSSSRSDGPLITLTNSTAVKVRRGDEESKTNSDAEPSKYRSISPEAKKKTENRTYNFQGSLASRMNKLTRAETSKEGFANSLGLSTPAPASTNAEMKEYLESDISDDEKLFSISQRRPY